MQQAVLQVLRDTQATQPRLQMFFGAKKSLTLKYPSTEPRGSSPPPPAKGSIRLAVHRRRRGGTPPDHSDHSGDKMKFTIAKILSTILLGHFWYTHFYPLPLSSRLIHPCPRYIDMGMCIDMYRSIVKLINKDIDL